MVTTTKADRRRALAETIATRVDQLAMSRTELGRLAGLNPRTIRELCAGHERRYTAKTLRRVEQALSLPRGTLRVMLDPTELSALRREHVVTLRKLAEAAGVSAGYLSDIESGTRVPSTDLLMRLVAALDFEAMTACPCCGRDLAVVE